MNEHDRWRELLGSPQAPDASRLVPRSAVALAIVAAVVVLAVVTRSTPLPDGAASTPPVEAETPGHPVAPALQRTHTQAAPAEHPAVVAARDDAPTEPGAVAPATLSAAPVSAVRPPVTRAAATPQQRASGQRASGQRASGQPATSPARTAVDADRPDLSKCAKDGRRQQDVTALSPPCVPRFYGDNGGATWQGVTATTVTALVVRDDYGPFVERVLQTAGVAASPEEEAGAVADFARFFKKRYESYGRDIQWQYHRAGCQMNASAECAIAEARRIVERYRPFVVVVPLPLREEFFAELARAGVMSVGGWHAPARFYEQARPYRYAWMPDGTRVAHNIADYWCQKLAGKQARLAGDARIQQQQRKLGIVTIAEDGGLLQAKELSAFVARGCGDKAPEPVIYSYKGDFSQSQKDFAAIVANMQRDGVTTVACLCDPVRPTFLTSAADMQRFYPEHLLSGMHASDLDVFGRLYSPGQWRNAFGPVLQPPGVPPEQQDHYKAYRDVGAPYRCYPCQATFAWMHLATMQIQWAGPRLTPESVERGTHAAPSLGGFAATRNPLAPLVRFGPGQYTAVNDSREVYWDASASSPLDGRPGSYVCVDPSCRRHEIGRWPAGEPKQHT